jgi:RNA polymerase sigma-70 factor (ECF subfamily)
MATDEELIHQVAAGDSEAIKVLHTRYVGLVFHVATQSLGAGAAEDLVQDVFVQLWRRASTYDPARGPFRPWLLQIVHFRIINELRSRSRRPELAPDEPELLSDWADPSPTPPENAWQEYRKAAVRRAVDRLPPAQRQALSLAFFDELSHDQVAEVLKIPLGTAKTRIRAALLRLRGILVSLVAIGILVGAGGSLWLIREKEHRALSLVTSSHAVEHRLVPNPGDTSGIHGWYRYRPGFPTAVLALHLFPRPAPGVVYQGWVRVGTGWISVGTAVPDSEGNAVVVTEGMAFVSDPLEVEVTRERGAQETPRGPILIRWAP